MQHPYCGMNCNRALLKEYRVKKKKAKEGISHNITEGNRVNGREPTGLKVKVMIMHAVW